MKPWDERPEEIANLLNPAFCSEIIRRCLKKYNQVADKPFDYSLLFLILPIVLHAPTREQINTRMRKPMHVWLEQNQYLRIEFGKRAKALVPVTKESISFLLQNKALLIDDEGKILLKKYKKRKISGHEQGEIADIFKKSEFVGQWFASAGTPTTIYMMWGVKP
ncbi:hypothetical protein BTO30_14100 [Domibacillus antri]|uniref:Uncharacterized protein n=1 Tax=Domibacillus antri TaxID=1714264 RepID=A0A1Q8Q2Q0_9BACI|nr:three component ABC system middle component [Domibacillus antri]OLN21610.1 hypothetical protein BTO30_14100 [Domibacillus antri]